MNHSRTVRRVVPLLLLFAATSTGTLLASDPCRAFAVETLNNAARSTQQRRVAAHKYSEATLKAWKEWGKTYLAEHGHPFVPPKRQVNTLQSASQTERPAALQFACERPLVPTSDTPFTGMLTPEDLPPFLPDAPTITSEFIPPPADVVPPPDEMLPPQIPGPSGGDIDTDSPTYTPPVFLPPFGGGGGSGAGSPPRPPVTPPVTPPVLPPPVAPVPEPGSFALLATGIAAMWGARKSLSRSDA